MRCTNYCYIVPLMVVSASAGWAVAGETPFHTPSNYLSALDSPYSLESGFLEDFEDGLFNTLGVTANAGRVLSPGFNVDSVDGDDGLIDGHGNDGHSWFVTGSAGELRFTFDADALGGFPTWAGVVWTDGRDDVIFKAFDSSGTLIGTITNASSDGSAHGETGEDRFFGLRYAGGIRAISIWNTADLAMEVDHLQYGGMIPAPSTLGLVSLVGLMPTRRRR